VLRCACLPAYLLCFVPTSVSKRYILTLHRYVLCLPWQCPHRIDSVRKEPTASDDRPVPFLPTYLLTYSVRKASRQLGRQLLPTWFCTFQYLMPESSKIACLTAHLSQPTANLTSLIHGAHCHWLLLYRIIIHDQKRAERPIVSAFEPLFNLAMHH
jgi:hypothetical protein